MDSKIYNQDPSSTMAVDISVKDLDSNLFVGIQDHDEEIDGLELTAAAKRLSVSVDELWRRIKNGVLLARTHKGDVYVYTDIESFHHSAELPPLPDSESHAVAEKQSIDALPALDSLTAITRTKIQELVTINSHSPEIALLIDHLSLAKEENREILRLTQDSMSRLTHLTDSLIDMKNAMIASKEDQISILKLQIEEQSKQLMGVLKEKENLETLTAALQNQKF